MCRALLLRAGASQFGSGWAWLAVGKDGKLKVTKTANAENPWVYGDIPLLTMDVWVSAAASVAVLLCTIAAVTASSAAAALLVLHLWT